MKKYWQIFKISFQQEFAYKVNFIMWRVRNVFYIFMIFFLWSTVFSDPTKVVFGYDRAKILTYVFGLMIVRAIVGSARALDISGDVAEGRLSNYLLKPVGYFKYWFTRDISSKALNLGFSIAEFTILYFVLKPPFFFQTNPVALLVFLFSLVIGILIYFFMLVAVSAIPFWAPELGYGGHFLVTMVLVEALSGALFPINVLPQIIQSVLLLTPFPYLIYFPIEIYLGNISGAAMLGGLLTAGAWVGILWLTVRYVWMRGLRVYEAVGR